MEISHNGLKFIQSYEGCVLHPYKDIAGNPTIGWGMTHYPDGTKVTVFDKPLTQEQADAMFLLLVKPYTQGIIEACNVPLNQNQLDALTSFAYNCGVGAFKQSTLRDHVNNNCVTEQDFTIYSHAGKTVLQGLYNRRVAEYNLFISKVPNAPQAQSIKMDTQDMHDVLQVTKIKNISVTFDRYQAGNMVQENCTVPLNITPELLAAMHLEDAGLVEGGYNIELTA